MPFFHLFPVLEMKDFFLGDCFHAGEDLTYQLINDTVQKMRCIAGLTAASYLLVFLPIANIAVTLHAHFGVLTAGGFCAGGQIQTGTAMPTEHISGEQRVSPGLSRDHTLLLGAAGP